MSEGTDLQSFDFSPGDSLIWALIGNCIHSTSAKTLQFGFLFVGSIQRASPILVSQSLKFQGNLF